MQKYLNTIFTLILFLFACISHASENPDTLQQQLTKLEASFGGRIGISSINTANHQSILYRAEERFPMQSTFKLITVSAILKQSMKDHHLLQQRINYKKEDVLPWSPITEKHIADGMTISELCAAAMMYSDNTAINLLMQNLGGPKAVTHFARSIRDKTFRVDNWENNLNSNPDDLHDTTTPAAMASDLQQLALGTVLAPKQREQLVTWMKGNTTGDTRIRAGVPKGYIVADKTGSGDIYGISNDIAIIWPPHCAPIVVAIYTNQSKKDAKRRDDIIASATHLLIQEFAKADHHYHLDNVITS